MVVARDVVGGAVAVAIPVLGMRDSGGGVVLRELDGVDDIDGIGDVESTGSGDWTLVSPSRSGARTSRATTSAAAAEPTTAIMAGSRDRWGGLSLNETSPLTSRPGPGAAASEVTSS